MEATKRNAWVIKQLVKTSVCQTDVVTKKSDELWGKGYREMEMMERNEGVDWIDCSDVKKRGIVVKNN